MVEEITTEQLLRTHRLLTGSCEGDSIMNQHAPGHDWIAIVRKKGTAQFGKAFAPPEHIQLYHSPLQVVVEFSRELAKRLEAESRSGFTS
jgi:hypothetical protein